MSDKKVRIISDDELKLHHCFEQADMVLDDSDTTAFKRCARLKQALWRQEKNFDAGTQPMRPKEGEDSRLLGSRMDVDKAREHGWNFLSASARKAADSRIKNPEPHQTLHSDRLYADLLSSMPMCFNLFGSLADDLELATTAVKRWWNAPGKVRRVRFEWSPGRLIPGRFLENKSAFDVAFELELDNGRSGIIGVETKYHEHCKVEDAPKPKRLQRYEYVTGTSRVFREDALDGLVGTALQQVWLDHLLLLSMRQDEPQKWEWGKFVLVHPAENPSYAKAAARYRKLLVDEATFEVCTIESLLDGNVLPAAAIADFRQRYLDFGD